MEKTDYVGIVSGRAADKSTLFDVFYGELPHAPLIRECPLAMACRVQQTVELAVDTLYIADIVEAFSEERFLTDGRPDVKKMDPFVLTMPDNGYWRVGEKIGTAWSAGKKLKKA
jgi:flavin reductase (DIM6/NTAB) family NADH-FMN oxidoreductase RutF